MRVVVTGATGNKGSSVVRRLAADPAVTEILGIARRRPHLVVPKTTWMAADIAKVDITDLLHGADAVVHLAWLIQPSRNERETHAVNVEGSSRVFESAARAGVGAIVYASSVGVYSRGPKNHLVDESWPTEGIPSSFYSRHKVEVERILDLFEAAHPDVRVVRLRPGLVFKREAASAIRRLFVGPLLPNSLVRRTLLPIIPATARLRLQAVHTEDVAEAYRLAVMSDVRGAFNIAAEPVIGPPQLGQALGAIPVRLPAGVLRGAAALSWKLRLQPTEPGWIDLALGVPLMSTARARAELGWAPQRSSLQAFNELFDGIRDGAGMDTPPLAPRAGGRMRLGELRTGVGQTSRM